MLRVLDLFSGIGGFSLGLERTGGFQTVAFCEIDPFCRRVLAKHWPDIPCYDDVRTLTADALARDGIGVDVICGGFPCQDVSHAGKRTGLEGARSGLWREYGRLIGELRPRFVIVENVPGLLSLGMGDVLGDLAALRYDACWDCIPASAVGAPHRRDRVWVIAHAQHPNADDAGPHRAALHVIGSAELRHQQEREPGSLGADVADADSARLPPWRHARANGAHEGDERAGVGSDFACAVSHAADGRGEPAWVWGAEPDVGRVAHGVPARVDRLRSLGNAVVPQVVEVIGRAILQAEQSA